MFDKKTPTIVINVPEGPYPMCCRCGKDRMFPVVAPISLLNNTLILKWKCRWCSLKY